MSVRKERKAAASILWIALALCSAFAAVAQTSTSVFVKFSVDAGGGGTITAVVLEDNRPITSGEYVDGDKTVRFTAVPAAGSGVAYWTKNGEMIATTAVTLPVKIEGGASELNVTVSFKRTSAKVTFSAEDAAMGALTATVLGGAPIVSGNFVSIGATVVFNAVPFTAEYDISHWMVNETRIPNTSTAYSFTIPNAADVNVTVSFVRKLPPSAVVTFSVKDGVGVLKAYVDDDTITSGNKVNVGKKVVFKAFPDAGYDIALWRVNGAEIVDTSKYTHEVDISSTASVDVTVLFEVDDDPPDTLDAPLKGHLKFGPNPVRSGDEVAILWDGEKEIGGDLSVFNAVGSMIAKVNVNGTGNIGVWNTSGVATGTYLIRGMLRDKDGFTCRVLMLVGVIR
jgi:hypothetical protein